ncbi:Cyclin B2,1 isoform 1 [Hibiscus syriacus]|uniref:Cyclin B2,1 isoform 1 n=1 Tax=Hibiscus syriacus TaxID=106335 RepID=A0A6A2ZVG6_HIBSY|nr:Cyclin B2,1 isoform 1 [Hibiscus syriacus]
MFHLALVNNPQDAFVVWTFASVLYYGNWKLGVEFARELGISDSEVKFVPEISGFSETKSDEDLAKEVAQLASLVQDSVWTLTKTGNLLESMSRYAFSPCSGLVFIPKSTAKSTAKLFDLIVQDVKSFTKGRRRKSREINYHLLEKGDPCETRYVLVKIILETTKAGPSADAAEIVNDEKDSLQPKLSDEISTNNQSPMKKNKRRAPSLYNSDGKGRMPKKQKLVETNQSPSEPRTTATKNWKLVAKDELKRMAKKQQKLKEDEQNFKFQGNISGEENRSFTGLEKPVVKESNSKATD